jgi:charged multivesicular body protein 1
MFRWSDSASTSSRDPLADEIFNLRLTAKRFNRTAIKYAKEASAFKVKVKLAIANGDMDGAEIYASDAISRKQERIAMLRSASRVLGVAGRLEKHAFLHVVNAGFVNVVHALHISLKTLAPEKMLCTMDTFEAQLDTLDVQASCVEESMSNTTAASTPANEVRGLMQEVADAAGLAFAETLPKPNTNPIPRANPVSETSRNIEEIEARLKVLRSM